MTTRPLKRASLCIGVVTLWVALAAPSFATRTVDGGSGTRQRAFDAASVSDEPIALETCPTTAFGDLGR